MLTVANIARAIKYLCSSEFADRKSLEARGSGASMARADSTIRNELDDQRVPRREALALVELVHSESGAARSTPCSRTVWIARLWVGRCAVVPERVTIPSSRSTARLVAARAALRLPRDQADNIQHPAKHPSQTHRCRNCRKFFNWRTGTAMQNSNLGAQAWVLASYILSTGLKGTSSMKLHRDLGVTQKTAWHLAHRIRETWQNETAPFAGPVEVDETFVGGLEKNKPAHKKLRQGRGTVGKTVVAGVKDRETGLVSAAVVPGTDRETLQPFVVERTQPARPCTQTTTERTVGCRASGTTPSSTPSVSTSTDRLTRTASNRSGRC